jgi:hypothetical protein
MKLLYTSEINNSLKSCLSYAIYKIFFILNKIKKIIDKSYELGKLIRHNTWVRKEYFVTILKFGKN